MTTLAPNPEQQSAIEDAGVVFVSAGAGTGKTTVLVERFVRAVAERGLDVDSVLVITYTDRAAGELRARIRTRLLELGREDLAREVDGAWISTIHGFCFRVLRAHAFEAGLDPRFRVLDESQARLLRAEAFDAALALFCAAREPERLELLATYGARRLRSMLLGVFERLRSAGQELRLAGDAPHGLDAELAALRAAVAAAGAGALADDERAAVEGLAALASDPPQPERLLDLSEAWPRAVARRAAVAALGDAVAAVEHAALEHVAARDRALLERLLDAFAAAYREAKDRESAADFEDLQLVVRDLLRDRESVRARLSWRFRSVMVDEFQDTNRLQCELIDRIAPEELFFVGDEFQSIYRFRHADVSVFRDRRARTAGVLALTRNYRSRPGVLDVVNHVFRSEFGDDFEPLRAAGRFDDPAFGPAVEVLVTHKPSYRDADADWREGEAAHVARRVRELVDDGVCTPGEVVVLFEASTQAETYERALRAEGLPTHRAAGRGYFGQQQVVDLLAYLRLLQNRYDDEALATVLASPLVGVSNDALALVRRAAGRRPLFSGLEREPPDGLAARDRRLLSAFRQRYDRLVRVSGSLGLEALCERILTEHDYDLALLARWDGKRRFANVRKLGRLARAYEELRGPKLEGFVRFVRDLDAVGAREGEAVAEEEGADAIRMLTIHAAKGLEFKVVVVADCGRGGLRPSPDEILCLPDGRFGFKVADPLTGRRLEGPGYRDVREAEEAAAREESRRLYYVAMTRAVDRLVLAGSIDPARADAADAPLGWVLGRLGADLRADWPLELDAGGTPVVVRVDRAAPACDRPRVPPDEQLELFAPTPGGAATRAAAQLPGLFVPPAPPRHAIRRLSYSALALHARCSYRFWVERLAGVAPRPAPRPVEEGDGIAATELGDAVHVLIELGARADAADRWLDATYPDAAAEDRARVHDLLAAWDTSPLGVELASSEALRRELPFAFAHGGVLFRGRFDALELAGRRARVVDYKTNRLDGADPHEVVDREYRLQVLVYALAALRAGAHEVETVYAFLEEPDRPVVRRFTRDDEPELEAQLSAAIAAIEAGPFVATPHPLACAECPVLDVLCAGPRLAAVAAAGAPLEPADI